MIPLLLPLLPLAAPPTLQEAPFEVSAHLTSMPAMRFGSGMVTVSVEIDSESGAAFGWNREPTDARPEQMRPLITLEVPPSVELLGAPPAELVKPADFAQFFLDYPYGRHMPTPAVEIPFRLIHHPRDGETLGINVTAFIGQGEGARFVRRRLELPLVADAEARPGDPRHTSWGRGQLAVGQPLPSALLPDLGGGELELRDLLEDGELLLFTYRAHW